MAEMLHKKGYDFEYLTEKELKYLLKRINDHFYKIKKKRGRTQINQDGENTITEGRC